MALEGIAQSTLAALLREPFRRQRSRLSLPSPRLSSSSLFSSLSPLLPFLLFFLKIFFRDHLKNLY